MNLVLDCFNYVISDSLFWSSMAFTTMVGIFIGAVIYDGNLADIKKSLISLGSYAFMIVAVNFSRAFPDVQVVTSPHKPLAPIATIIMVTIFYLIGMLLGVYLIKKAHK